MKFVVFRADGAPIRDGSCPDHALEQQAGEGETVVPWDIAKGSPTDWRLIDGVLTKK